MSNEPEWDERTWWERDPDRSWNQTSDRTPIGIVTGLIAMLISATIVVMALVWAVKFFT